MSCPEPRTLCIESGGLAVYTATLRGEDEDGEPVALEAGIYTGSEPLALYVWPQGALPAVELAGDSGASWRDAANNQVTLTLDDSDTPGLVTGDHVVVMLTDGGDAIEAARFRLDVTGSPAPAATDADVTASARSALLEALSGPKRVKGDMGEVEQHSINDLIAADRYVKAVECGSGARRGLRITKLIPPSSD